MDSFVNLTLNGESQSINTNALQKNLKSNGTEHLTLIGDHQHKINK
jgi:hypothetical protein